MRVKEVNLGNGLVRLVVEPTCTCERHIPTHVVDEVMKDIVRRKKCEHTTHTNPWGHTHCTQVPTFTRPTVTPNREPDGIDVHVDRPLRQNFRTHHDWAVAMAKYRTLEDVAKDCDWECREPMKGTNERPWNKPCLKKTQMPWWVECELEADDDYFTFCGMEDDDDDDDLYPCW